MMSTEQVSECVPGPRLPPLEAKPLVSKKPLPRSQMLQPSSLTATLDSSPMRRLCEKGTGGSKSTRRPSPPMMKSISP